MRPVCIIDTSILCELLQIPRKHTKSSHSVLSAEMRAKVERGEALLLPLAAVLETGNHIGYIGNGQVRRKAATEFASMVDKALSNALPFTITPLRGVDQWREVIARFPEWASQHGSGLGDLSIVETFNEQCALFPRRRVYIWSLDKHMHSYDRAPQTT